MTDIPDNVFASDTTVLTVPGLFNSGPQHWQSYWETAFGFKRINQKDWETPVCSDWLATIDAAVAPYLPGPVILIGHSLACNAIVRWAEKFQRNIQGALLVGPSDVEAPTYPPGTTGFLPMPSFRLPFRSLVIASSNDPYVSLERARFFAGNWGSELINAGDLGHINSFSGLDNWPFGITQLRKLF
jgi:uncharacterized protein